MRIGIIGAGIIGVTTAYELAADGHEVTVYRAQRPCRRRNQLCQCRRHRAGLCHALGRPGHAVESAAPSVRHAMRRCVLAASMHWRICRGCGAGGAPAALPCTRPTAAACTRLATYSRQRLHALTQSLQLEYERSTGYLVLLRGERERAQADAAMRMLRELEVAFDLLDAAQCRLLEPGLSADTPLLAAIGLPGDEVGNCRQFAQLLSTEAQQPRRAFPVRPPGAGADRRARRRGCRHTSWLDVADRNRRAPLPRPTARADFDAVVVCAGPQANALLAPLGCSCPSSRCTATRSPRRCSIATASPHRGPLGAVMDENTRWRSRAWDSASASREAPRSAASPSASTRPRMATLYKVLNDWFPGAARLSQAQRWKGARPMLPDGPRCWAAAARRASG